MVALGSLVATGRTSDLFEYGRGAVVKVPRPGVPGHWARHEAEYTAAVRSVGVPTPDVLDVIHVDGRCAIVFEHIDGESMWARMCASPSDLPALTAELASVHRLILGASLPRGLGGSVVRTCRKIDEVVLLTREERGAMTRAAMALPRGAALLHGDLHPGNVLMARRGPVVIDWFDSAIGHPIGDVVRSALLMRPTQDPAQVWHLPGATSRCLRRLHGAYVEGMAHLLDGCHSTQIETWESVIAASRLAEGAEPDDQLLGLCRRRQGATSTLVDALSAVGSSGHR